MLRQGLRWQVHIHAGGLCLLAAPGKLAALRLREDASVEGIAYLGLLTGFLKLLDRHGAKVAMQAFPEMRDLMAEIPRLTLAGPGPMIRADWSYR